MKIQAKAILVHPHKNHAYQSFRGILQETSDARLITLLYQTCLMRFLMVHPKMRRKMREFHDPAIPANTVVAPFCWALRVMAQPRKIEHTVQRFDAWVARRIRSGKIVADFFHLFQDYLPETALAVKSVGSTLVVEQILNQSPATRRRCQAQLESYGLPMSAMGFCETEENNNAILSDADVILVPSNYVLEGVADRCCQDKIVKIPYGADTDSFETSHGDAPDKLIRILTWAKNARKGGHLFFPALAGALQSQRLHEVRVEVVVLGGVDPQITPFVDRCRSEVGNRFSIAEQRVPSYEVPRVMRDCDLFVLPSLSEGMALTAIEAAAAGLPLVITPSTGFDGFRDGEEGYLIPECTLEACQRILEKAFEDRASWPKMGAAARKLAERHSWRKFHQAVGHLYHRLMANENTR